MSYARTVPWGEGVPNRFVGRFRGCANIVLPVDSLVLIGRLIEGDMQWSCVVKFLSYHITLGRTLM